MESNYKLINSINNNDQMLTTASVELFILMERQDSINETHPLYKKMQMKISMRLNLDIKVSMFLYLI